MKSRILIEQWMDIHGLEYNELFYVILNNSSKYTCYINEYGLFRLTETNEVEDSCLSNDLFIQILNDKNNFVISKLPYVPANEIGRAHV